ncbi:MAG TPA: glutathione S-transferase N-terminal domain-containing protein [Rhizomicrobium sp.]|nr:glutathione S-transferase N-terminal domain-containing protein [Rhizomicrobium sp.]
MKLYGTPISPFTRKAMVIAHELGLKLEVVPRPQDQDEFRRINPLGKIPALVLDDGSVLIDSPVICEYLNHVGGGKFFPGMSLWKDNNGRWKSAGLHALSDGVADAAVARVVEGRQATPNQAQIAHHMKAVEAGLDALERMKFTDPPTIGEIAAACALGYIDFRLPDLDWRASRPKLSAWYAKFREYPSMKATEPK